MKEEGGLYPSLGKEVNGVGFLLLLYNLLHQKLSRWPRRPRALVRGGGDTGRPGPRGWGRPGRAPGPPPLCPPRPGLH